MTWELPKALEIEGRKYAIRTDYRDILKILTAFHDPDLKEEEKVYICLFILFIDFERLSPNVYETAFQAAAKFLDGGREWEEKPQKSPRLVDWEQDGPLLFPAINHSAGVEVRSLPYMHWWTFLGFYLEIQEGVFSTVLSLRQKRAKGKKLEKWEREFWQQNKDICALKKRISQEEQAERDRLNALLG